MRVLSVNNFFGFGISFSLAKKKKTKKKRRIPLNMLNVK